MDGFRVQVWVTALSLFSCGTWLISSVSLSFMTRKKEHQSFFVGITWREDKGTHRASCYNKDSGNGSQDSCKEFFLEIEKRLELPQQR